jgi:hypothetical protein
MKVVNEYRIIGSTKDVRWQDIGFTLKLPLDRDKWKTSVDSSGDAGNQVIAIKPGKDTKAVSSFQAVYRHYGNPECRGGIVETLARAKGASQGGAWRMDADGRQQFTITVLCWRQQFPVEWEATPEGLTLHLWSRRRT